MWRLLVVSTLFLAPLASAQGISTEYKVYMTVRALMRDIGATPVACPPESEQAGLNYMCGTTAMTDLDAIYEVDLVFNTDAAATEWEYRPWNDSYNRSYWVDDTWLHLLVIPIDKPPKLTYLMLYSTEPEAQEQ